MNERYLFIHVMKTGGTSLLSQLRAQFAPEEFFPDPDLDLGSVTAGRLELRPFTLKYLAKLDDERKRRLRFYAGHFPYVARRYLGDDVRTLTVLRHPVDRTISLLRNLRRGAGWEDRSSMGSMTLEEIYERPNVFESLIANHQTKLFALDVADEPTGFMQPIALDRERLAVAKANLRAVDVLGVTERYDDFLAALSQRFGWRLDASRKTNTSPPTEHEYDVASSFVRRIEADNALDLELYDVARDLVDERRLVSNP